MKSSPRVRSEADLIELGRLDLPAFSRWPLGYTNRTELADHQVVWQELLQDRATNKLSGKEGARNLCLLGPSEHGKTYGMNVPFVLWALSRWWRGVKGRYAVHGRNLRVGIMGSKEQKAIAIGTVIDRLFKVRADDLSKFGVIPGFPWNTCVKHLVRDDDKDVAPSITCFGPESEIQGDRFDILIMADFFTVRNQSTHERRKKMLQYLDEQVYNRMEERSFIIADGHHVDNDDGYHRFEEDDENWEVVKYRAIIEEPTQENKYGKVLWPHKWDYKKLDKIRGQRPATFELMFQNRRTAKSTAVERSHFDACLDRSRPILNYLEPWMRLAYRQVEMWVDPAFSLGRQSSFSVCWIIGLKENGDRDVLHGWRLKLLPQQLKSKIRATIMVFLPDHVFIEANAAQILLVADIEQDVRKELGEFASRIKPVYTTSSNPEESVEHGVGSIIGMVENCKLKFPYLGETARDLSEVFWTELSNWPQKPDDTVMAMVIGERGRMKSGAYERKFHILKEPFTATVARKVHPARFAPRIGLFGAVQEHFQKRGRPNAPML